MEISVEKPGELQPEDCVICDIRGERDRAYGFIPGSVGISAEELLASPPGDGKKADNHCARGVVSVDLADELCDRGLEAYSLEGGFTSRGCARRCAAATTRSCASGSSRAYARNSACRL